MVVFRSPNLAILHPYLAVFKIEVFDKANATFKKLGHECLEIIRVVMAYLRSN